MELIRKIDNGLCRSFSENDVAVIHRRLKNASRRFMGREVTLEEAYALLRCDQLFAANLDLIRVPIEIPMKTGAAGQELVLWFTTEAQDKRLLGKIVSCRRDFGGGCLNVAEHIEKNMREATERDSLFRARAIKEFKEVLYQNIPEENLIYDREFCRLYVREPPHCSVGD